MPQWIVSPSTHFMWSALALLIYVLSTRVDPLRRPQTSAIAWVMGLALLPYLFLPLYLLFGRRKRKLPRVARIAARDPRVPWAAGVIESFGLPPARSAAVRFHADGAAARAALWETLDSATRRLDLCSFLVADDAFGRELIGKLTERARDGIAVRLMIDGAGLWFARQPSFVELRAAGAQVETFHPLLGLQGSAMNPRNHRKFVLADDARLWSGGRNFASEYFLDGQGDVDGWVDLSFDLRGAVAADAARQFESDWKRACRAAPERVIACADDVRGPPAQFLPSGPDQSEDTAQALLVAACYRAQHRLIAVTPYFVPDESLLLAMRLAALRGVRVTLVLPLVSNHRLADFVRGRALRALAMAGAAIRLAPRMIHAKAFVVDDALAMCGSINLDARSLFINYEAAVVFYGAEEIAWLARWIEGRANAGDAFISQPPGIARDLAEGLLLTLAFQL
jgi:cardiolipin synthase